MIINNTNKKKLIKKIFNFIYYLRYLILIFIFSIFLVLTAPKLFNYVDKIDDLNEILKNQYGFIIKNSNKIKYKIIPQPNLEFKDSHISIGKQFPDIKVKELQVFTNFKNFYISDKILIKKIKFRGNFFGNDINGYYIPQQNTNFLFFELKKLGIESKVFLEKNKKLPKLSGIIKSKLLDDNLIINFNYDQNLEIKNSVFKNKDIYTSFDGIFNFKPFFSFQIFADIKKINLKNVKFKKLFNSILEEISSKKLNGEVSINYLKKKIIGKTQTKSNKIYIEFNNGDIILKNSTIQFSNLDIQMNFYLKRYPLYKDLNYELLIETDNINKFFKTINIDKNKKLEKIKAFIKGNINLDAQKYYFEKIIINKKNIKKQELIKLKKYLDKNTSLNFDNDLNEKDIYLLLKDLIEFI